MLRLVKKVSDTKALWQPEKFPQLKLYKTVDCYGCKTTLLPPVRLYSSVPPPKPAKKSSSSGVLYTLGTVALVGGATLSYAKYDPEFRKTLVDYAPFTDTLINILFQEESTLDLISDYYNSVTNSLFSMVGMGPKSSKIGDLSSIPIKNYKAPAPVAPPTTATNEHTTEIRLESKEKGQSEPIVKIVGGPKPKGSAEVCDENVQELEEKISDAATEAIDAYNRALHILKTYNKDIEYIIDEAVDQVKPQTWDSVREKTHAKNECIRRAKVKADEAAKNVNKLKGLMTKPHITISDNTKILINNNIAKMQEDIKSAQRELDAEIKHGSVTEKYWEKVEQARKHFCEELEILFPTIDLAKKKLNIDAEDFDLFVLHMYSKVLFYQKELAKMETITQNKVRQAVETARRGGGETLNNAQICEALEQEKRRLTLCFQQQCLKLQNELGADLRDQLKHQSQAFSDHLSDAIKTKEMEIEQCLARKFDEQLENERGRYKMQAAALVGRLRGLDQALKAKADADECAKRSQILWSACQSLLRAIRAGCPGMPWKDQIRPLEPEIVAVKNAAGASDELVAVVLQSIPPEAKVRGVYPEDALRERFLKVEEIARTVALVPESGAALPVHILSYMQSLLLVRAASAIPQAELNDEKIDFSDLNTHDILQRARYWMDRGDFAQALKYMNLLKGAPRSVAKQWMNETRILLETQQAANTLMAHAASSGLMYL